MPQEEKRKVKRSLAKGSALIETTDDVFREIKNHLTEYDQSLRALLETSAEIYRDLTQESGNPSTQLGLLVADSYRELLKDLKPSMLKEWAKSYEWLGKVIIEKRKESVFFRDPFVILLGWLITEHQVTIPKDWPVELGYLEEFYNILGISTDGIF